MEKQQNRYITLQKTLSKQEFYILIEKYQKTQNGLLIEIGEVISEIVCP